MKLSVVLSAQEAWQGAIATGEIASSRGHSREIYGQS
jgi:hypothetical protein